MNPASLETLCIVMPCYNEAAGIHRTVQTVDAKLTELIAAGRIAENSCMLLADDGSRDNTWAIIEELHGTYPRLKASALAGNRGKEYALFAGLMYNLAPKLPFIFGGCAFLLAAAFGVLYIKVSKNYPLPKAE